MKKALIAAYMHLLASAPSADDESSETSLLTNKIPADTIVSKSSTVEWTTGHESEKCFDGNTSSVCLLEMVS